MAETRLAGTVEDNDSSEDHTPTFADLAAAAPDDPRREQLRTALVTQYLSVAEHIARRFSGRGEAYEDLLQVARVGLINAVDRFEPERGTDFLSFAVPTIMGEVRRHFRDASWSVRVPRRLKELHLQIGQASSELGQRLGRAPTPTEIARELDLTPDEVSEGLQAGNAYYAVSVDKPAGEDDEAASLADTLGEEDYGIETVENHEALQPLLRDLAPRERTILMLRFFGNMTQTQIAKRVGISQMHVSRLLAQTLQHLREKLTEEP
ncbi:MULTISPECIES: SigB/SigF/SigG family RNA polymerase sigma factor [Amycolatopsis]|uniref:SigB/SigF/SigG family RNA polymerase sigma factor n=1 Tax=Amycolatopsis tucumanensis TaxID=401106 RepID=A0ABP7IS27_9PSEU|nr:MULTISPECIES: SigB/SigF/SigG family RNA polymerase sigma factor [Amycolatopsis]MCF6424771.1 SigB/SigF/SigG family RNA polymerase sigma factor [Amycolatopsis tucumanensis]